MAVQAQYPSNVLFLNNKNGQEHDQYSLQPQPPSNQSNSNIMLFNTAPTGMYVCMYLCFIFKPMNQTNQIPKNQFFDIE